MVTTALMRPEHIPDGLRLCRAAGWNQTARDWAQFLDATPDGARIAVADGGVVGTAATIRYGGAFAWIGMVLVDPAVRGRGIGTRLFDEALGLLSDIPVARLDATPLRGGVSRPPDDEHVRGVAPSGGRRRPRDPPPRPGPHAGP
jgi:GNAT superfamily N-acetyltransferase